MDVHVHPTSLCYLVTLKLSNYLPYFKFAIRCKSLYTHIVLPIYDLCLALKKATFGSLLLLQTFFHLEFGIQKIYQKKKIQTDHIPSKV